MKGALDRYEFMSFVDDNFDKCENETELVKMKEVFMKDIEGMFVQGLMKLKLFKGE